MTNGSVTDSEKLNIYVKRTVLGGVKPIELFFEPVLDNDMGEYVAYRAYAKVNSVVTGVLSPSDYLGANVSEKVMVDFTVAVIKKTVAAACELSENGVKYGFISVKCPTSLVYAENLYSKIKVAVALGEAENSGFKPEKICLEFNADVMQTESEKLKSFFSDLRAAGVKVAVSGYGGEEFSIEKLLSACPDVLFTDEKFTRLICDREKGSAVAPILNVAKSLGGIIVAEGVTNDEELREFRTRDCFGFIPSETYRGRIEVKQRLMTFEQLRLGDSNGQ